ncbi:MAG: family 78 glycoside hydrolase catalytic domain, partial [Kiritimatiellae bacterium]|nr:family 78 glycoside hydrolase catalytic domain [Kiritimatiellia bacterium]
MCALGLGEIFLNGRPIAPDRFLSPYSDYRKTLWYTEHDVTLLLRPGENLAAAALGNGFYNESLHTAWNANDAEWRDVPKLLFRLELRYPDGTEVIEGDEQWRTDRACSPYRYNQLRCGETYDANYAVDWMMPDFDDAAWVPAVIADAPAGELRLCPAPPIREFETYECIRMQKNENGSYTFDFGQNMSGYVRIRANQPAGTRLRITYAEQIEADGSRRDTRLTTGNFDRDCWTQSCELVCGEGE